jgi:hypothetical protein
MMELLEKSSPYSGDCSPWYIQAWTTTPENVNLLAVGLGSGTGQSVGYYCRRITIQTAGTLVVTRPDGKIVTLTCASGETLDIEAKYLASTSTAQGVKVYW